jgi:hypothetical protein
MARAAHALRDGERVWLIDPFEDPEGMAAAAELGAPAGVIQLLDRHNRDCAQIAARLAVPHHRLPASAPAGSPFEPIQVISGRLWNEVALWWEAERALVIAEAIGTAPLFALSRRAGVHPLLRLRPPRRQLEGHQPEALLVGHGEALTQGGDSALREAFAHSLEDLPRLLVRLPQLLRGG